MKLVYMNVTFTEVFLLCVGEGGKLLTLSPLFPPQTKLYYLHSFTRL